jgi:hypothetical protein
MKWLIVVLIVAAAAVLMRIYIGARKLRAPADHDWDAKQIEQLRAQGSDPFQPHTVDFFFALPSDGACDALRRQLEFDGFSVDSRSVSDPVDHPYSLHASKELRLSVPGMRDLSRRFGELAQAQGGRYDGWTAAVVRQR